jgi:hypothetical protein
MTIAFNSLGRLGRLGNQMFQYASLRGISHNVEKDFCFPIYEQSQDDGLGNLVKTELFDCFQMSSVSDENIRYLNTENYVQERFHHFDEDIYTRCPDNVSLYGYFQTEKYFTNVKDIIKKDFTFKDEILDPCREMFSTLETDKVISLHIRRGDYLLISNNHPLCELEYYAKALQIFENYDKVIIFTDDLEWCKGQSLFDKDVFMISESKNNYIDLCLMTMCSGHIIANSSFSWWGAWLANSQKVVAPNNWFGPDLTYKSTKDIYLENWIKL